jgi:hypothetical protein
MMSAKAKFPMKKYVWSLYKRCFPMMNKMPAFPTKPAIPMIAWRNINIGYTYFRDCLTCGFVKSMWSVLFTLSCKNWNISSIYVSCSSTRAMMFRISGKCHSYRCIVLLSSVNLQKTTQILIKWYI